MHLYNLTKDLNLIQTEIFLFIHTLYFGKNNHKILIYNCFFYQLTMLTWNKKKGLMISQVLIKKRKRISFTTPSFEVNMFLFSYTDLNTMSLIWICFNKLGFTLLIAAVSFRFGLIFQTVLPICPFSPTPRQAYCSPICLWIDFTLLNPAHCMQLFTKLRVNNIRMVAGHNFNWFLG